MSLRLDFTVRRADFALRVDTTIDAGRTVAVIGANDGVNVGAIVGAGVPHAKE